MADLQSYYNFSNPLTGEKIEELLLFLNNNIQSIKEQDDLISRVSELEKQISEIKFSKIDGGTY